MIGSGALRRRDHGGGSRRRAGQAKDDRFGGPPGSRRRFGVNGRARGKGAVAMIYGEPETPRFLATVRRLKRQQHRQEQQTRLAKQRVRLMLKKLRTR